MPPLQICLWFLTLKTVNTIKTGINKNEHSQLMHFIVHNSGLCNTFCIDFRSLKFD